MNLHIYNCSIQSQFHPIFNWMAESTVNYCWARLLFLKQIWSLPDMKNRQKSNWIKLKSTKIFSKSKLCWCIYKHMVFYSSILPKLPLQNNYQCIFKWIVLYLTVKLDFNIVMELTSMAECTDGIFFNQNYRMKTGKTKASAGAIVKAARFQGCSISNESYMQLMN